MSSLPHLSEFPSNDLILDQNVITKLRVLLDHSMHQSGSGLCAILEETGSVIVQLDHWKGPDLTETGVLSAASFGASVELSKRLGNPAPPQVLVENDRFSVLVTPTIDNFLIINIFGTETNAGIVRHVARATADKVCEVIKMLRNTGASPTKDSPESFDSNSS